MCFCNSYDVSTGSKISISLKDMDYQSWKRDLRADAHILEHLYKETSSIRVEDDFKLQTLKEQIKKKIERPINYNNKKIIIFTAFADTANYLYDNISKYVKDKFDLFKSNPEEFIIKAGNLINEQKATLIVQHISYTKIDGDDDTSIFTEPRISARTRKRNQPNRYIRIQCDNVSNFERKYD